MLTSSKTEKLDEIVTKFLEQRSKGVTATYLADKAKVSIKDAMSYLIEKEILVGEKIDLELLRVLFEKNKDIRNKFCSHLGIPYATLDKLLLVEDESLKREVWTIHQQKKTPVYLNGFIFSLSPFVFSSVTVLIFFLMSALYILSLYVASNEPPTTLNVVLRIMEGI